MTRSTRPPSRPAARPRSGNAHNGLLVAVVVAVLVLIGFQLWWASEVRSTAARIEAAQGGELAASLERVEIKLNHVTKRVEELSELGTVADEWPFVVDEVTRTTSKIADLTVFLEHRFGEELDVRFTQPAELDWTQPDLREAARRSAESVGIALTDDEVRIPSKIVMHQGLLEYFAVLKGGKEHEALVSLQGNTPADDRRPHDFGAKLNNALQALGFKRGKPLRVTQRGVIPPEGQTVYMFLEWEEDGERVVVRAEDLVWNRHTGRQMEPGAWVYVGSSYVPGDAPGEALFAADLTAEAVATYSAPNTIIDNTSDGAADDTVFIVATPRLPEEIVLVDFVIRLEDKQPTRTFPEGTGAPSEDEVDDEPVVPREDE